MYRVLVPLIKNTSGGAFEAGASVSKKELEAEGVVISICLEKQLIKEVKDNGKVQTELK